MTVVTFVNPKGGVGKTTSAMLLAEYCSASDLTIALIDLDPNENLIHFNRKRDEEGRVKRFPVIARPNDVDDVLEIIENAEQDYDIVIVDLEGSRDKIATLALSQSTMAVIPLNGSAMEARQAAAAMKLVRSTSKIIGKPIPQWCLFTRVNAGIAWSDELDVRRELEAGGLPVLKSRIEMRSAYTQIFRDGLFVSEMISLNQGKGSAVNKYLKAKENADEVSKEIVRRLLEATV